ncbi:MAG: hypothetical protein JW904_10335 [Spirochaetales bacterium]|nr:hypothetical protein [Spirochaetales bacterium]
MTIFFIHTVSGLKEYFDTLTAEILPDADTCHLIDESIIRQVETAGGLTSMVTERLCDHAVYAQKAGAAAVQFTCSSISPAADIAAGKVNIPVLKVDLPMVMYAVNHFTCIGVAATVETTLGPTTELLKSTAAKAGKNIVLETRLCAGAFAAFKAGDYAGYTARIKETVNELTVENEVIILAQASMARALAEIDNNTAIPVLSSPRMAVEHLRQLFKQG